MSKIVIIGGGASGIVAGIFAASAKNEVIILEKNDSPLKKLLITGNGKCNYFNETFNIEHYSSENKIFLSKIITEDNKEKILKFLDKIGIIPKIKNGYYYPYSNQSYTIKNALLEEVKRKKVNVLTNTIVNKIEKKDNSFVVYYNDKTIICDKVIVSVGSKAYPKTGSDGFGYKLAEELNIKLIEVNPGLVPLISDNKILKNISGVRSDVKASLYINDKLIKEEIGEIQFTDYGLSGICIYNLSNLVSLNINKTITIKVNFMNDLNIKNVKEMIIWFDNRSMENNNKNVVLLLESILNYKIVNSIMKKCNITENSIWDDLSLKEKESIAKNIVSMDFNITDTLSYDRSQVCIGGIDLNEVEDNTFMSYKYNNLYFTGELLDVAGDCGGYNLAFAFISGMIAGKHAGENHD